MQIYLQFTFLFFLGATAGWVMELFFRRFKKDNVDRKWVNPGFLNGPYLPIYGFGVCTLYGISALIDRLPIGGSGGTGGASGIVRVAAIFVLSGVGMTLIELIAGEIFILGFKVKLWDYDRCWGNYKGIICPLFSLIWAVLGTVYAVLVNPLIVSSLHWFTAHITFSYFLGILSGVMGVDVVYSFHIVARIRAFAVENNILVRYEELKDSIIRTLDREHLRRKFFLSFLSSIPLADHLRNFRDSLKERLGSLRR